MINSDQKILEIKAVIDKLKIKHQQTGDDLEDMKDSDFIEQQAQQLIIDYCMECGYKINGFPHEMLEMDEYDLEEDYFSFERYQLYLDTLTLIKEDVAELTWYFTNVFWPDRFKTKEDYLFELKALLESGAYYDITL